MIGRPTEIRSVTDGVRIHVGEDRDVFRSPTQDPDDQGTSRGGEIGEREKDSPTPRGQVAEPGAASPPSFLMAGSLRRELGSISTRLTL
jgi:hypothetical protein